MGMNAKEQKNQCDRFGLVDTRDPEYSGDYGDNSHHESIIRSSFDDILNYRVDGEKILFTVYTYDYIADCEEYTWTVPVYSDMLDLAAQGKINHEYVDEFIRRANRQKKNHVIGQLEQAKKQENHYRAIREKLEKELE